MTTWTHKDNKLREILQRNNDPDNELESITNTKNELIPHLKTSPLYRLLTPSVVESMQKVTTFHTFNQALDKVFDYADDNGIWVEF